MSQSSADRHKHRYICVCFQLLGFSLQAVKHHKYTTGYKSTGTRWKKHVTLSSSLLPPPSVCKDDVIILWPWVSWVYYSGALDRYHTTVIINTTRTDIIRDILRALPSATWTTGPLIVRLILQSVGKDFWYRPPFFSPPVFPENLFSFPLTFSLSLSLSDMWIAPSGASAPGLGKSCESKRRHEKLLHHFHSGCERNDMHFLLSECHGISWLFLAWAFFFVPIRNRQRGSVCDFIFRFLFTPNFNIHRML